MKEKTPSEYSDQIRSMRESGMSYKKISDALGLKFNSVRSYCKLHDLGGVRDFGGPYEDQCLFCGKGIIQNPGRKKKKFCSDECRQKYYVVNPEKINRKAIYQYECPICGKSFTAYGNSHRKYCSSRCFMTARHGYREYWDKEKREKVWQF